MTVEEARRDYEDAAREADFYVAACIRSGFFRFQDGAFVDCTDCGFLYRDVEAASIALDLANAVESEERRRRSVAW